ncbi:MAG: hypothetical protein HQM04_01270 [Magnetococcales bacterium]|nr:hypothetical protein [Magnetococcales bacterium]MBF0113649.1 hypothetical protein [Magnetococcales bacterium]
MTNPKFHSLPNFKAVHQFLGDGNAENDLKNILMKEIFSIEEKIGKDKLHKDISVYSTKGRVKTASSIFLKTKRKLRDSFGEYSDYAGVRVLVMFEEELLKVLDYLLKEVVEHGKLYEMKVFNMDDHIKQGLKELENFKAHENNGFNSISKEIFDYIDREPRYRSIHILFGKKINYRKDLFGYGDGIFVLELQLRTLTDDLWAEMEHKLAYKQGKTNQQLATSFAHLKDDLTTMGKRLSSLRRLRARQMAVNQLSIIGSGPYLFLDYENEWDPLEFLPKNQQLHSVVQKLRDASKDYAVDDTSEPARNKYIDTAEPLLAKIDELFANSHEGKASEISENNKDKIDYFVRMERGYVAFLKGNYLDAHDIYSAITIDSAYSDRPVPHLRLGEVSFVRNAIGEKSCVHDRGLVQSDQTNRDDSKTHESSQLNVHQGGQGQSSSGRNDDQGQSCFDASLAAFDKAVDLVYTAFKDGKASPVQRKVGAGIINKVASIYMLLGADEYLDYCIELYRFVAEMVDGLTDPSPIMTSNNLGWCYVEKMRISYEERKNGPDGAWINEISYWHGKAWNTLEIIFRDLEDQSKLNKFSSNHLDTASWFLFQTWRLLQHTSEREKNVLRGQIVKKSPGFVYSTPDAALKKAEEFCRLGWGLKNRAIFSASSVYAQRHHTEEIMEAKKNHPSDG